MLLIYIIVIAAIAVFIEVNKPKIKTNETEIMLEFNNCTISVRNKKLGIQEKDDRAEGLKKKKDILKVPEEDRKMFIGMDRLFSVMTMVLSLLSMYIAGTKEPFIISPDAHVIISIGFAVASLRGLGIFNLNIE